MKISIITPTYNYGRFLRKCLESVWEQVEEADTFSVEHLIIDGISKDDTLEILGEWEKRHSNSTTYSFRWISEPDKGQTDAINKGLRLATGDLVCWLNADEFYLPKRLRKVAEHAIADERTDLFYGESVFEYEDGNRVRKWSHRFSRHVLLYYGCVLPSCATFWRRRILEDGHYLDPSYRVVMDGEYWSRLCRAGYRMRFLPFDVAVFLWHGDNVSIVQGGNPLGEGYQIRLHYNPIPGVFRKNPEPYLRFLKFIFHQYRRLLIVLRLLFLPRK